MQIRMTHQISGTRAGLPWPGPGEVIELPDHEAVGILRSRMGVPVETPAVDETATTRRKPATRRKSA